MMLPEEVKTSIKKQMMLPEEVRISVKKQMLLPEEERISSAWISFYSSLRRQMLYPENENITNYHRHQHNYHLLVLRENKESNDIAWRRREHHYYHQLQHHYHLPVLWQKNICENKKTVDIKQLQHHNYQKTAIVICSRKKILSDGSDGAKKVLSGAKKVSFMSKGLDRLEGRNARAFVFRS